MELLYDITTQKFNYKSHLRRLFVFYLFVHQLIVVAVIGALQYM